jgi:acetyl-CoA C-acetyltransferase
VVEQVLVVDAVRTPLGRRDGALSSVHPARLLAGVLSELLRRTGVDGGQVQQVITGCVSQVGEQSFNIGRTAWLSAGLPEQVGASTVDAQCGSSQQAFTLAAGLVRSGLADVVVACGVESMSRIPIGSNFKKELGFGRPVPPEYLERYRFLNQYQAAEAIASKWQVTRDRADEFGLLSQQRARTAWAEGRFGEQIVPVEAETATVARDEGLRETSLEALSGLQPVVPGGIHTAGTASQISDGAAAVLVASEGWVSEHRLVPKACVVDSMLIGVDPVTMLTGPHEVTPELLRRNQLAMSDIDLVEINEAFASIVLSWADVVDADLARVNPNGGAIALGHPLGATGAVLITKAVHELERTGGRYALVTMCCGGGLGTGTLLERAS